MRYATLGAVAVSVAVLSGGVAEAQEAGESPLSRTLSIQQTAVYDVKPPPPAQGGLDVVAWVDRSDYTYASGEEVKLFVETNKDAYVTVLNVDPAGQTTVLFPNEFQPNNLVRADRVLEVPDPTSLSRIVVTGTTGTELIKVLASTEPVRPFQAQQLSAAGPFHVVQTRAQGVARSLTVAMLGSPAVPAAQQPAAQRPAAQRPVVQSAIPVSSSNQWAVCHQTISTIPALSASLQRTRSLQVTRTSETGGSAACEESAR